MSQLAKASTARLEVKAEPEPAPEGVSAAPILITQHEVAFGTAAAVPVYPTTTTRWWVTATRAIAAALRRGHYPPRRRYLDDAVMAREMHRL
jgi:hypothetical protein